MEEEHTTIVLDNGSSRIKAGFSGDDAPRSVFYTVVSQTYGHPNGHVLLADVLLACAPTIILQNSQTINIVTMI